MFGPKYATTNTSLLYTAKGLSAFVVPLANILKTYTGSWYAVFAVAAVMNFIVVAMIEMSGRYPNSATRGP